MGLWSEIFHGTDSDGNSVTVGDDGKGGNYVADGHVSKETFFGKDSGGTKGHDHADNKGGYKDRGKYTG